MSAAAEGAGCDGGETRGATFLSDFANLGFSFQLFQEVGFLLDSRGKTKILRRD